MNELEGRGGAMLMWNNTFQKGALQWVLKLSLPQEIAFSTIIESWLIVEDAKMSNDGALYVPLGGSRLTVNEYVCRHASPLIM